MKLLNYRVIELSNLLFISRHKKAWTLSYPHFRGPEKPTTVDKPQSTHCVDACELIRNCCFLKFLRFLKQCRIISKRYVYVL